MTILIINTLYYPSKVGGAEKSVQILAEKLVEMGHKVVVVCLTDKKNDVFMHNGVKVCKILHKNIYWAYDTEQKPNIFLKTLWHSLDTFTNFHKNDLRKIIKTEKPDLAQINNISGFSTTILKTIRSQNLPIVQTLRDYYYLCYKTTCYNNGNCCELCKGCKITSKSKLKNLNLYCDYIVGISQFIIKKFQKHGLDPTIPTTTIYNALDKSKTEIIENKKKTQKIIFGYIGSISSAKGVEDMLKMFNRKCFKHYQFQLNIAGNGQPTYINTLKARYSSIDVKFLGFQKPSNFYQTLDALIVPSQWNEPFGRVVIEGAQFNLPIFVSKNGALPELKKVLKTVNWFDEDSVLNFLKNHEKLSINYNLSQFSSKKISQQYEHLFSKLVTHEN